MVVLRIIFLLGFKLIVDVLNFCLEFLENGLVFIEFRWFLFSEVFVKLLLYFIWEGGVVFIVLILLFKVLIELINFFSGVGVMCIIFVDCVILYIFFSFMVGMFFGGWEGGFNFFYVCCVFFVIDIEWGIFLLYVIMFDFELNIYFKFFCWLLNGYVFILKFIVLKVNRVYKIIKSRVVVIL